MNRLTLFAATLAVAAAASCDNGTNLPPDPFGPTPTEQQLEWQKMELNMFVHFGPNTFTGREW